MSDLIRVYREEETERIICIGHIFKGRKKYFILHLQMMENYVVKMNFIKECLFSAHYSA